MGWKNPFSFLEGLLIDRHLRRGCWSLGPIGEARLALFLRGLMVG